MCILAEFPDCVLFSELLGTQPKQGNFCRVSGGRGEGQATGSGQNDPLMGCDSWPFFRIANTSSLLSSKCWVALLKLKCINTVCFQNLGRYKMGRNSLSQSFGEGNCRYVNWILTHVLGTRQSLALFPQPYEIGLPTSTPGERRMSVAKGSPEVMMVGFGCEHRNKECSLTTVREKGSLGVQARGKSMFMVACECSSEVTWQQVVRIGFSNALRVPETKCTY